jgi:antirestriction protein ArdC
MVSTSSRRARGNGDKAPAEPRTNLYDDVTAKIISELEAGRFPWVQPWGKTGTAAPGLPRNALTGSNYSGVNVLILWGAVIGYAYLRHVSVHCGREHIACAHVHVMF